MLDGFSRRMTALQGDARRKELRTGFKNHFGDVRELRFVPKMRFEHDLYGPLVGRRDYVPDFSKNLFEASVCESAKIGDKFDFVHSEVDRGFCLEALDVGIGCAERKADWTNHLQITAFNQVVGAFRETARDDNRPISFSARGSAEGLNVFGGRIRLGQEQFNTRIQIGVHHGIVMDFIATAKGERFQQSTPQCLFRRRQVWFGTSQSLVSSYRQALASFFDMEKIAAPATGTGTANATKRRAAAPAGEMSARERFLRAAVCDPVDFPPVWLMRQAGRALPEYRELKEKYPFLELVRTPELATEVTLQPIRRFGFDAAILFSDILVVPEAMGQGYRFRESGGVQMDFSIASEADIERLEVDAVVERLSYVPAAIRMIKSELGGRTALIGFAGSPWTLANFMLEGGSFKEPSKALTLLKSQPCVLRKLLEKLTFAVTEFLRMQLTAGVDAIQIFDSHGGLLPTALFRAGSGLWMERILRDLKREVPVILFSKGTRAWQELAYSGANVIGVDHGIPLRDAVAQLPTTVAVQGNLDPGMLMGETSLVARETQRLISVMRGRPGWIFNLGHGLPPGANLDCIYTLIETLRSH